MVAEVFRSVAAKYDIMNDLMSMGIHRVWKRFTIDCSGIRKGQRVLDLGGGTGDLTAKFSRIVGETEQGCLAFDINNSMLKRVVANCVIAVLWVTWDMFKPMRKEHHFLTITLTVLLSTSVYVTCRTKKKRCAQCTAY